MPDALAPASRPAETVLALSHIQKTYGSFKAVSDVSFELRKGEILTLLGPSGCGKTSTLRIAIGLERATAGEVRLDGRIVDAPRERTFLPPEKRNMGMVFQSYAIWPHMSVFENVAYPLRARRRPAAEIRDEVTKLLRLVGLEAFAERRGTQLSGGQQQRVAIARGLAVGPDVLLMDEPFSNLDARLRNQMRAEVKVLQRRLGIAVLFVTHDQSEALALSDRIAVMRAGNIEQIGSPSELYRYPQTPSVRDFLGETRLLPGRILKREPDGRVTVELDQGVTCVVAGSDHTRSAPAHTKCLVAVRPEHIHVEPVATKPHVAQSEPNALGGEILALLFMGNCYEASIKLADGTAMNVTVPPGPEWREGGQVRLRLSPEHLQLWPAAEAKA
ncbi:ABC transporter ATP-binding protein [Propylenella binzhouense]|nr:ABC transporter ATP-binding protein [Propylenella binzhouense]